MALWVSPPSSSILSSSRTRQCDRYVSLSILVTGVSVAASLAPRLQVVICCVAQFPRLCLLFYNCWDPLFSLWSVLNIVLSRSPFVVISLWLFV